MLYTLKLNPLVYKKRDKILHLLLLTLFLLFNCEDQSPEMDYVEISVTKDCNTNLSKIRTVTSLIGKVVKSQSQINLFVIEWNGGAEWGTTGPIVPCNPPAEIQIVNLEIIFSGDLYEDIPGSNAVGVPFKLTSVKIRS